MSARELDAAGITRAVAAGGVRDLPAAQRRARPDLLPVDAAAPPAKRPYVHALYGFARYADELVDDLDSPRPRGARQLGRPVPRGPGRGDSRPTPSAGRRSTRRGPGTSRPDTFEAFLAVDADGHHRHRLRDVRRPRDLHARLGRGHRRCRWCPILEPLDDRGRGPRAHPRRGLPALELHPRRRRGPAPRPRLPAAGGPRPVRRHARRPARRVRRPPHVRELLRFEIARTRRALRPRPAPASPCCTRPAATASARRSLLYGGILDAVEHADYQVLDRPRQPCRCRGGCASPCPALVRARRSRRARPDRLAPAPPDPPRQGLHHQREAEQQVLDRGEAPMPHARAICRVGVGHDVAAGQPPVGEQLEEEHDRVRHPEHPPRHDPRPQDDDVEHDRRHDADDSASAV